MAQPVMSVLEALRRFIVEEPLSFLMFCLGALLLLLGITTGFSTLAVSESLRPAALSIGVGAVAVAVVLSLYRGRPRAVTDEQRDAAVRASATASPHSEFKIADLSPTQKRLLRCIEDSTIAGSYVTKSSIENQIGIAGSELFYRLEQLRLMELIDLTSLNPDDEDPSYAYRLSARYSAQLGRETEARPPRTPRSG
jgi:hypothetical protein